MNQQELEYLTLQLHAQEKLLKLIRTLPIVQIKIEKDHALYS